jgi:hypothetical protein
MEPLRGAPQWTAILDEARMRRRVALAVFERGGGPALLGVSADAA